MVGLKKRWRDRNKIEDTPATSIILNAAYAITNNKPTIELIKVQNTNIPLMTINSECHNNYVLNLN